MNIRNSELNLSFVQIRLFNSKIRSIEPIGLKLLIRFRLGLSHLNECQFRHNFQDCLNHLFLKFEN